MAVDSYTEEQYTQLVREICLVPELTLGAKRSHDQDSSEVPLTFSKSIGYLLTHSDRTARMPRISHQVNTRRSGGEGARGFIVCSPGPSLVDLVSLTA